MFEFEVVVSCPYCDEDNHTQAAFDRFMEPMKVKETCSDCKKEFFVLPSVEVEAEGVELEFYNKG